MVYRNQEKDKIILNSINKNIYYLDDNNNLYSQYRKKQLKLVLNKKNGYYRFCLHYNKKQYNVIFHVFVWIYYNKKIPKDKYVIDHIDGNIYNNNISNLQEISIRENTEKGKSCHINGNILLNIEKDYYNNIPLYIICDKYKIKHSNLTNIMRNRFKNTIQKKHKPGPKKGLGVYNIIKIKKELKEGAKNIDLANKYNCNPRTISKIKNGERWKEIII